MGQLDSVEKVKDAWYRLIGTEVEDPALVDLGETEDDVAYLWLTEGAHEAQEWMIRKGYDGWRKRGSAITSWTGADSTDGGRFNSLPADFLRAWGNRRESAFVEANGRPWGQEIDPEQQALMGNHYYFRGDNFWITRGATPPTTLYLQYHYLHPNWSDSVTIDFPLRSRSLIVAEAANMAKEEDWFPGDAARELKIERAVARARERARRAARQTKSPRQFRPPARFANRW